ncbi:MAG: hypothetical protein HRT61_12565 [Ekhidna sp.]|nr:hypothetical protein [Ekhidna sp.]
MRIHGIILMLLMSSVLAQDPKSDIVGLWQITLVKVGDQTMTPDARWMRFNTDLSQESGNGWFQHSYGTYTFDSKQNILKTSNTNMPKDPNGPFKVAFDDQGVTWERMEDGMKVVVFLEKTSKLPSTMRDDVLGLWKLTESEGKEALFANKPKQEDYLFIRWDGKFVIGSENGKKYGVYNVHAHKPEIEFIPYGDVERSFWRISDGEDGFSLQLLNTEDQITRSFQRLSEFPN